MSIKLSRRLALGLLGAGGLAGTIGARLFGSEVSAQGLGAGDEQTSASAAPAILSEGTVFDRWRIVAVHPMSSGSIRVDASALAPERGGAFVLEILARDATGASPTPPAEAGELAIYVRNGGNGSLATNEEHGLAAMALAEVLRRHDAAGPISGLLTHEARAVEHHSVLRARAVA